MQFSRFTNQLFSWWAFSGDENDILDLMEQSGDYSDIDLFETICTVDLVPFTDPFTEITGDDPYYCLDVQLYPFVSLADVCVLSELDFHHRSKIEIDWEQLNETPEAVKFQLTEKQWRCNGSQRAYEIGRFITNEMEVGLIQTIETELTFEDNDLRWPRGDSTWHEREFVTGPPGVGEAYASWCIKMESLPGVALDPNDFRIHPIVVAAEWFHEIPGTVHPELRPWMRMIFPWGKDNYTHLRCPPGSLVSLWVYLFEDNNEGGVNRLGGMMKGVNQIMGSDRTYENITRVQR